MRLLKELHRTKNDSYSIVDVDRIDRRTLPKVVNAVPMALLPNGRVLVLEDLFATVFRKPAPPPEPGMFDDTAGSALAGDAAEDDPKGNLEQFFFNVETPKEDAVEDRQVSLDALQQARAADLQGVVPPKPMC